LVGVGGTVGVRVGGTAVAVGVGGLGVAVAVAVGGSGVDVGGSGVLVAASVAVGADVAVAGWVAVGASAVALMAAICASSASRVWVGATLMLAPDVGVPHATSRTMLTTARNDLRTGFLLESSVFL
jgi:hypothetical protein